MNSDWFLVGLLASAGSAVATAATTAAGAVAGGAGSALTGLGTAAKAAGLGSVGGALQGAGGAVSGAAPSISGAGPALQSILGKAVPGTGIFGGEGLTSGLAGTAPVPTGGGPAGSGLGSGISPMSSPGGSPPPATPGNTAGGLTTGARRSLPMEGMLNPSSKWGAPPAETGPGILARPTTAMPTLEEITHVPELSPNAQPVVPFRADSMATSAAGGAGGQNLPPFLNALMRGRGAVVDNLINSPGSPLSRFTQKLSPENRALLTAALSRRGRDRQIEVLGNIGSRFS